MTHTEDKEIEEAIKYLVFSIHQTGKNPKPVILHSIRVGISLYKFGYKKDIVIGGILHDLLEDTDVSFDDLKQQFGDKIARLVYACSFDESIKDETERYKEATERCLKEGKEALIIKAADFIDNIPYTLNRSNENDMYKFLSDKTQYFIEKARGSIVDEVAFQELEKTFNTHSET